jgi:tRNA threonylcarbamoyladenosine biosynthesis protein TsaE
MFTNSERQTFAAARRFGKRLKGTETVYLRGPVGVGKTVFVKGLAKGLNISETVTSPTFTYVHLYESGRAPLRHFDLYRVKSPEALTELGLWEELSAAGVKAVEWPELLGENKNAVVVTLTKINENKRELTIENFGR